MPTRLAAAAAAAGSFNQSIGFFIVLFRLLQASSIPGGGGRRVHLWLAVMNLLLLAVNMCAYSIDAHMHVL